MQALDALFCSMPLLRTLPLDECALLTQTLVVVEVAPGNFLFREGDIGGQFYIVLDGRVEILKAVGTPEESRLAVREEGEFFGEMSLLNPDGQRTASARAMRPARLLQITRADFDTLLRRCPMIAYDLASMLSVRMTVAQDETIQSLSAKNRLLQQAYDELKAAQAMLIEKEKLERELQLAREIQKSILPVELPPFAGYDFGALMSPARAVGGDFYGIFPIRLDDEGERMALVIGDVTDKGVPAAIFMAQAHALLRAEASHAASPGQILQRANRFLVEMNEKNLFVTVVLGILEGKTGVFQYARAGHELPAVMDASGNIHYAPLGGGAPLGIFDEPPLDENTLVIPPGGMLLLYTDGIPDGMDAQGNPFGHDRLAQTLRDRKGASAQQACEALFAAVNDFGQGTVQFDDITLLAARRAARPGGL